MYIGCLMQVVDFTMRSRRKTHRTEVANDCYPFCDCGW